MAKRVITDNPAQGLFNTGPKKEPTASVQEAKEPVTPVPDQQAEKRASGGAATAVVVVPDKKETRSKKKLFLFEPSLYMAAETKCQAMGISMNEAANQLFRAWLGE